MPSAFDPINHLPDDANLLKQHLRERMAEMAALKLMVDKLTLQLTRRLHAQYGTSSERFNDGQASLLESPALHELPPSRAPRAAANAGTLDRRLPAHLPREQQEIRPDTTPAHQDALGQDCGCASCGGRLRRIGADVSEHLEYVPALAVGLRDDAGDMLDLGNVTIPPSEGPARCGKPDRGPVPLPLRGGQI